MWWMLLAANAGESEVSEEVVVWARPFARFDDKRWSVRSEVVTPSRLRFGVETHVVRANAWQLEAVVHCKVDAEGRLREATCSVESAALRVHVPKIVAADERAIDGMAASLVGRRVQLQVNDRGRVPNVDLDGMDEDNSNTRALAVTGRALMTQLSAAFHMEIPKENPVGASWVSYSEPLLALAAPTVGMSSVEVAHRIDAVDGNWIEQVQGRATSTTPVPNPDAGLPCFQCKGKTQEPEFISGLEFMYTTEISAVSVIDGRLGYPTERVWSVRGKPTASSPGSLGSGAYWSAGSLKALDPDEAVEVGTSGMVGPPGGRVAGQRLWVSVTQSDR